MGVFEGSSKIALNTKSDDSENRASCMPSSLYTPLIKPNIKHNKY